MSNKSYVDLLYAQSHTSQGRVAKRTGHRQSGGRSMTTHTPGPWEAEQLPAGHFRILAKQGPLTVSPAAVHGEADARLIAAAPEMLAELQALADWVEEFALPTMGNDTEGGTTFVASARAAIAKAEGSK